MKVLLPVFLIFILVGCQNDEGEEATAESAAGVTQSTTESVQSPENTTEDSTEEVDSESTSETEPSEEGTSESTTDSGNDNSEKQNKTTFDIDSEETQEALFSDRTLGDDKLMFPQDVITEGMTQAEVEELYGKYDKIYPGSASPIAIYGNLGVIYTYPKPYETGSDMVSEETDPEKNKVAEVLYYAGVPYDEVVEALGKPDRDVYEIKQGPTKGLKYMDYLVESDDLTYKRQFRVHENKDGDRIVGVMLKRGASDDSNNDQSSQEEIDSETESRVFTFIHNYINSLMNYYNNKSDEGIMDYVIANSPSYESITSNKSTGNFSNHETHNIEIKDTARLESNILEVTVEREYSHATSDGRRITKVKYTIVDTPEGYKLNDYEEVDNYPSQ